MILGASFGVSAGYYVRGPAEVVWNTSDSTDDVQYTISLGYYPTVRSFTNWRNSTPGLLVNSLIKTRCNFAVLLLINSYTGL
jgi:hypothetical protein